MSVVPEEERFFRNTTIMAQAIKEGVERLYKAGYKTIDPSLIDIAVAIISRFEKHHLIRGFIEHSHNTCWDSIKCRNEEFFIENAGSIFGYLPMDKVNLFKDLFTTKDINGNNVVSLGLKNELWSLLDAMIKISIQYIHKGRGPYSYQTDGGIKKAYGVSFFDNVDIGHHASTWEITEKLEFPLKY